MATADPQVRLQALSEEFQKLQQGEIRGEPASRECSITHHL
jgi:hypothetical protein